MNQVEEHAPREVYTHIKTYGEPRHLYCNSYEILNEDLYLEWVIENMEINTTQLRENDT